MNRAGWAALALACVLVGCVRTSDGVPVAGDEAAAAPATQNESPEDGITPTSRIPLPAQAATCPVAPRSPVSVRAQVSDPAAPIVTINFPRGWSMTTRPRGDVGAVLEARNGISATVKISKTALGPAEAFSKYLEDATADAAESAVSVMPADLCGYSGQKILGTLSHPAHETVKIADRILHVWTNTGDYLVAVHVQARAGTSGFDGASSALTQDFAIVIP